MKKLIIAALALVMTGAAYAGCGVKIPVTGELKAYDAEKKEMTVGTETITLAASATVTGADGKKAELKDLIGKEVTVSTDKHNKKGESVTEKKTT